MSNLSSYIEGGNILAPMVRVGTLPLRLQALDYGASVVYSEETVDYRLVQCKRYNNDILGTVDFKNGEDGEILFRTCPRERERVVLQLGTANAERALEAARLVQDDVAGIDVNMGCPKHFSIHAGMGAALLERPETVKSILTTLVDGLDGGKHVSCKIRILSELEKTLELCQLIEKTGVSALAVHGRLRDERPRHANHDDVIMQIRRALNIPVIANGGSSTINTYEDIEAFKDRTTCSSVMLARAAHANPSVFRSKGLLPLDDVVRDYLKYAVKFDNSVPKTKYVLQMFLKDLQSKSEKGKATIAAASLKEFCDIWDLSDFFAQKQGALMDRINRDCRRRKDFSEKESNHDESDSSSSNGSSEFEGVTQMKAIFVCKHYRNGVTPKLALNRVCKLMNWNPPAYQTWQTADKRFLSQVKVNSVSYAFVVPERSKKYSEQAAALVAVHNLGYMSLLPEAAKEDILPY